MSYIEQLLASLERRLNQLTTEIAALERARAELDGQAPPTASPTVARTSGRKLPSRPPRTKAARSPARPARVLTADDKTGPAAKPKAAANPAPRRTRGRQAPAARRRRPAVPVAAGALEQVLAEATTGLSAGAVAERLGAPYGRVLELLRKLEGAGQVRRTGARRSTLWRLITDEERIAQRAAELARRTGASSRRRGTARAA
jgi:hypothetical protein